MAKLSKHTGKSYGPLHIICKNDDGTFTVTLNGSEPYITSASTVSRYKLMLTNPEQLEAQKAHMSEAAKTLREAARALREAEGPKVYPSKQKGYLTPSKKALRESREVKREIHHRALLNAVGSTKGALKVVGVRDNRLLIQCECGQSCKSVTLAAWQKKADKPWVSCGCRMAQLRNPEKPEWAQGFYKASGREYHGMAHTSMWGSYRAMLHRCYDTKHSSYPIYGGRGIEVCDEWKDGFIPFMEWSLKHGWQEGYQIDRVNPHGHYTPGNCRWVSPAENLQARDEMNHPVRILDTTRPLKDWLVILKLTMNAYRLRLRRWGDDEVKALVIPDGWPEAKAKAHIVTLMERAATKGKCISPEQLVVPLNHRLNG